jgi:hypothetical protein
MGTTNRAEELAKESKELFNNYSLGYDSTDFGSSIQYLMNEQDLLKALVHFYNSRQSEIDELTKEKSLFIEKYTKSCNEVQKLEKVNDELTKVIDGYKSDSEELITTKELLLDLTISDKKVYDKQEQRIINLSEKLLISEKSEKFYKDRAKELSDILYLAESENAELTKEVERLRNLNTRLFTLWESLYEAGEISISKNFSASFNEIRESINK